MATEARPAPRRRSARGLPDSPNPIDIAMAAVASGKALPDVARRLLEEQADLLHAQRIELRMRHVGEMVRAALWAILAVAALLFVGLIVSIMIKAARTDALIVQSFRVPPALAVNGLTGEVVASQVLDKLAEMQVRTESSRAASSYANNWENDLKIDIPNTGATTDQVWKLLRGWLGKETRISGEVIQTDKGLALTTRVGAEPGRRFVSAGNNVDELVTQGAEAIFRKTQPYRYAIYLGSVGRAAERQAILLPLTRDPSPLERKWAWNGLDFDYLDRGQFREAIAAGNRAMVIDSNLIPALNNSAGAERELGHQQAMIDLYLRSAKAPVTKEYDPVQVAIQQCRNLFDRGYATRNAAMIDELAACAESLADSSALVPAYSVFADLLRNDPRPALAFQQASGANISKALADNITAALRLNALMLGPPSPELAKALDVYVAGYQKAEDPRDRARQPTDEWPTHANALSMLGRHADAKALIEKTPIDCYDCVRVRGLIAQRMGDRAGAQRWFLEAAKQGPRLAPAFLDWGRLLLDNRRYASAEPKLRRAAELAPNWADPLKSWGDLLAAQGKREDALAKYDAALKLAPNWQELRAARRALAR